MVEAVSQSAAILREGFGRAQVLSQQERDIKLDEDKRSEQAIVEFLRNRSRLPILTEEAGWVVPRRSPDMPYWVLDPLDGSFNYSRGVPLCCVALALCRANQPIAGCVFDFVHRVVYWGGAGYDFTVNGAEPAFPPYRQDILATGLPVAGAQNASALTAIQTEAVDWKKIRMIGSAALSLAWVAEGKFDGYVENGIRWWDVAAGLALVEAAGGSIEIIGDVLTAPLTVRAGRCRTGER
jgi:myo-inositol-1(or 4)-monophosphatase